MSRDSSPPPLSDDSAVGSLNSNENNGNSNNGSKQETEQANLRPKLTRPSARDLIVEIEDLELAAKQMRTNNVSLISRSVRTVLSCFDDLDVQRFEARTNYLTNFISNGINKCSSSILRPVSILWPDHYEKLVENLAVLDAFLINTQFREKPVDWMLDHGLTSVPKCRQCKEKMNLSSTAPSGNIVRWQCQRSQACSNYFMPIQRPSFFSSYEKVSLDKLLFSIYYWATCTPGEELYQQMNIEPVILNSIWRRLQNVCRVALEKTYPRYRLTNVLDQGTTEQSTALPIDLVSIKLNDVFVVCAKHPNSNLVRLGLYIPNVSTYSFVELTESWFAHGAEVRVSESKFLDLMKKRTDLKVKLVPRLEMVSKDGHYYRDSAFGYLTCQLAHVLKDFDSSSLSRENLKLILAEMQWRELYGTSAYDSFMNIVNHMAQYGDSSECYSEPSEPFEEERLETPDDQSVGIPKHVYTESYFYATVNPVDEQGEVISNFTNPQIPAQLPKPDVRVRCHECQLRFECFEFSLHLIAHLETTRKDTEGADRTKFECKHCFKVFDRDHMRVHSALFRCHYHNIKFGCRICCVRFNDRSQYLNHMRRLHFEHEVPYRCPCCKFASSFQRDVFIHFQEEHRHSMIIMCPLCLRSFTVLKPELMTLDKMDKLSKIVYNHLAEHYILSKGFTCSNCCLCFLTAGDLMKHKQLHHNPLEITTGRVQKTKFIVAPEEEECCVKALPIELFISNKRPNKLLDPNSTLGQSTASCSKKSSCKQAKGCDGNEEGSDSSDDKTSQEALTKKSLSRKQIGEDDEKLASSDSDDDSFCSPKEGLIHVRGISDAEKFLHGGGPAIRVAKSKPSLIGVPNVNNSKSSDLTSQKIIDYLSMMKKADGIAPNQSVILTPDGKPVRCCECLQFVTIDHFVASIVCKACKYTTHCPRSATKHNQTHQEKSCE